MTFIIEVKWTHCGVSSGNLCRCTGYRPIVEGCRTFCQVHSNFRQFFSHLYKKREMWEHEYKQIDTLMPTGSQLLPSQWCCKLLPQWREKWWWTWAGEPEFFFFFFWFFGGGFSRFSLILLMLLLMKHILLTFNCSIKPLAYIWCCCSFYALLLNTWSTV